MNQRNVLVTGGFGFLGTHLVERLLGEGETRVHVVDNLSTSSIDVGAFMKRAGRTERITYDLCSVEQFISDGRQKARFDEIYHLASVVGPVGVLSHGGTIVKSIVEDTYRMIDVARRDKARLVDISTSEIYGGGRDGYCSENDAKIITSKVSVRLEYAVGKLACEVALTNMSRVSDLDAVIVRPFNIAGPRQSPKGGFVLPRFIGQALKGEPITVYGDGGMIRAFTHVMDMADGIVLTCRKGHKGEPYNVGNPANKISIVDLARRVIAICESKSEVQFVDPKRLFGPLFEEANDKYPDADRAAQHLGWHAKRDLDTVIRDTMEYIRAGRVD
jgi:UDP-glucose 4-epimerase